MNYKKGIATLTLKQLQEQIFCRSRKNTKGRSYSMSVLKKFRCH